MSFSCFSYESKKKLRNVAIGLFFLFGGVEYGVIIPTLWLFLQHTFNASESYYSVVLSAFSFTSLISSPFFGAWIDVTRKTKKILIVGLFFEIGGNFLYFMAPTKYLVLAGRLLCGVGDGVGSVLFAQIVRTSSVEERTTILSLAMATRQIGLVLGPALNLALKECNFYIGPYIVNNYRSPGILMALVWILILIFIIVCFYDLPTDNLHNIQDAKSNANTSIQENNVTPMTEQQSKGILANMSLWKELLNEEVVVIIMTQFIVFFNLCALEALVAPMMENLLGWQETKNSYLYSLIGIQIFLLYGIIGVDDSIIVYALVGKLSKRITDRWLMVIGLLLETAAVVLYIIVLAPAKPYDPVILPTISVGTFVIVLGLPFLAVGGVSLYSKITDERAQGFLQGIRRSFLRIGTILGALWGGSLFRRLHILIGVLVGLVVIAEIMMFLSFGRMKAPAQRPRLDESTDEERRPILS